MGCGEQRPRRCSAASYADDEASTGPVTRLKIAGAVTDDCHLGDAVDPEFQDRLEEKVRCRVPTSRAICRERRRKLTGPAELGEYRPAHFRGIAGRHRRQDAAVAQSRQQFDGTADGFHGGDIGQDTVVERPRRFLGQRWVAEHRGEHNQRWTSAKGVHVFAATNELVGSKSKPGLGDRSIVCTLHDAAAFNERAHQIEDNELDGRSCNRTGHGP